MSYYRDDRIVELRESHVNYYRLGVGRIAHVTPSAVQQPVVQSPRIPQPRSVTFLETLLGLAKIAAVGAAAYVVYNAIDEATMPKRRRHDREVKRAAKEELKKGRTVWADLKDWPRPPTIGRHRPDVFSVDEDGTETAIEIEHPSTAFKAHSISQVTEFDGWASRSRKRESILRLTSRY